MTVNVYKLFGLLGYTEEQTGGGCTAFINFLDDEGFSILITDAEGGIAPDNDTVRFYVGYYKDGHGDPLKSAEDVSLYEAIDAACKFANEKIDISGLLDECEEKNQ